MAAGDSGATSSWGGYSPRQRAEVSMESGSLTGCTETISADRGGSSGTSSSVVMISLGSTRATSPARSAGDNRAFTPAPMAPTFCDAT